MINWIYSQEWNKFAHRVVQVPSRKSMLFDDWIFTIQEAKIEICVHVCLCPHTTNCFPITPFFQVALANVMPIAGHEHSCCPPLGMLKSPTSKIHRATHEICGGEVATSNMFWTIKWGMHRHTVTFKTETHKIVWHCMTDSMHVPLHCLTADLILSQTEGHCFGTRTLLLHAFNHLFGMLIVV